jgi:phage baseplate assembly protein V
MIQYGNIFDFRYITLGSGKKLEVKVSVDDRVTNWLPVKTQASSFLVVHTPVRIGDQVMVLNPYGNNEDGFVIRGLTQKDIPLPNEADEDTFIAKFEDGTTHIHNTKTKEISLNTPCNITIITAENINLECKSAAIKADEVTIDSSKIDLGIDGTGVVTGECICPFTGSPHADVSSTVKATK